mmetsp:Transcript_37200/g.104974  ORF Transcript_37200/g.104974 Transcript_37200/m.104974 type:complete len:130 (+) Transcript_37200:96-485(+)|eukprot:CAMPEP_0117665696 /NCGR_PEP_ID=MMETSP0804-20121206/9959_1 /TAXON_ID=1074897 /ORGANISM="Tetraselmis astigmatica, Strain CCMP880" /LENGTH=129 /DNA_ID=CAMNT_0005473149 /DNA_START=95 /DNA_END=484 /DNA_ORIENTATION=-
MSLKKFGEALAKMGIKAPWQVTGPASHVEYKEAILKANAANVVRKHTPASQPMKVIIPQSELENIYNIRYYDRKERVPAAAMPSHKPADPEPVFKTLVPDMEKPIMFGKPFNFKKTVPLLDYENNGYTL